MKPKFTPGPWHAVHLEVRAKDARETIVCQVTGAMSNPATVADARLIAAAPELYEALRDIAKLKLANHMGPHDMVLRAVDRARTALAKVDA